MKIDDYLSQKIKWNSTDDAEFPYHATFEGKTARIRVNDFPADNLYTLIVADAEFDFDDWPIAWAKTTKRRVSKPIGPTRDRSVKTI